MTWGEFKELVESKGVKDHHKISYIDVGSDLLADNVDVRTDLHDGYFYIEN